MFANGKLRQAHGHVTSTMSAWPKYGYKSNEVVDCRLPHLYSYGWPLYVCRLSPRVVVFQSLSVAPDQSMTWFSFATWSVMADLLVYAAKSFWSACVNVLPLLFCSPLASFHNADILSRYAIGRDKQVNWHHLKPLHRDWGSLQASEWRSGEP